MSDFKSRLDLERTELEEKVNKLNSFLDSEKAMDISKDQRGLLKIQAQAMGTYLSILKLRLELL